MNKEQTRWRYLSKKIINQIQINVWLNGMVLEENSSDDDSNSLKNIFNKYAVLLNFWLYFFLNFARFIIQRIFCMPNPLRMKCVFVHLMVTMSIQIIT